MHKGKEAFKSVFLLFLIIASLLQTWELWLSRNVGRNFFTFAASAQINSYTDVFLRPSQRLTWLSPNRFKMEHVPSDSFGITLISEALSTGNYTFTGSDFNQRSIIYKYNFPMPAWALNAKIPMEYFDTIMFIPSSQVTGRIYVHFLSGNYGPLFTFTSGSYHDIINNFIQQTNLLPGDMYYVSTDLMGFALEQNFFVPRRRGGNLTGNSVVKINNHYVYEPNAIEIGESVSIFFPNSFWPIVREDLLIFGDQNIVVRYFDNMLEYINHNPRGNVGNLLSDFDIAMDFISGDVMVTNQTILSRFTPLETGTKFYFDYIINNLPVFHTETHWIEITVEYGTVTRYGKITYSLETTTQTLYIETDIIDLINSAGLGVRGLSFGYVVGEEVNLNWVYIP